MDCPPRARNERLLNRHLVTLAFFWYGLMESATSLGGYYLANRLHGWPAVRLAAVGPVYREATTMGGPAVAQRFRQTDKFTDVPDIHRCIPPIPLFMHHMHKSTGISK